MGKAELLTEIWRGPFLESMHYGHAVVADASGEIIHAWGDPATVILPRSSCKMIQALPLVESGAADAYGLTSEHLALACASHSGAPMHTKRVEAWLDKIGCTEDDLRCGAHPPNDKKTRHALIRAQQDPSQVHNNCSGKHTGFLTYTHHTGAGPEYVEPDHPLQITVKQVFEEVTGEASHGHAFDGCSAPNFATTVHGLARGMAVFAVAQDGRNTACKRLLNAMIEHPELVSGEGRACTELMRATEGRAALKTGADGVYTAILPEHGLGVALKISDGATRGSECAIAAILARLGVLDPEHPAARRRMNATTRNWRGLKTGTITPAATLLN